MQIMVPLDGLNFSERALPSALDLARQSSGVLHLVRVLPRSRAARAMEANPHERLRCESYLAARALELEHEHVQVRHAVLQGPVDITLEAYATDAGIDVVVMTTHGRGGIARARLGSVADALLQRINIPVLLIRPRHFGAEDERVRWNRMLVPLDGSLFSERALGAGLRISGDEAEECILLHVLPPPLSAVVAGADEMKSEEEQLRLDAEQCLARAARWVRAEGLSAETVIVTAAHTADEIVAQASTQRATIIVMATHGRTGWQRVALGSIASEVIRHAHVPVLMVRPAAIPEWSGASADASAHNGEVR